AAARRDRPGARDRPRGAGAGRARLRPGRVRPGAGAGSARRPAAGPRHRLPVHLARPGRHPPRQRSGAGDAAWPHRRVRHRRRGAAHAPPPLHAAARRRPSPPRARGDRVTTTADRTTAAGPAGEGTTTAPGASRITAAAPTTPSGYGALRERFAPLLREIAESAAE